MSLLKAWAPQGKQQLGKRRKIFTTKNVEQELQKVGAGKRMGGGMEKENQLTWMRHGYWKKNRLFRTALSTKQTDEIIGRGLEDQKAYR